MKVRFSPPLSQLLIFFLVLFLTLLLSSKPAFAKRSEQSGDVPLYPSLKWQTLGTEDWKISINEGRETFNAAGTVYRAELPLGKPPVELVEFYSAGNLGSLGWSLAGDAAGVLMSVGTYFKEPNSYLLVRMGPCPDNNSSCIWLWLSAHDVELPVPAIPTPVPTPILQPATRAPSYSNPLPVPTFSQNDGTWSGDQLGFPDSGYPTACNPYSFGGYGCWTTSYAMLYNYYSANYTTPRDLNNLLKTGSTRYASNQTHCNNLMPGGSPYAPSGVSRVDPSGQSYNYNNCSASNCIDSDKVSILDNELNAGRPVLLYVHYSGSSPQHMVVLTGHNGSTWYINDPWNGSRTTLASGGGLGAYVVDYYYRWNGTPPGGGGGNPDPRQEGGVSISGTLQRGNTAYFTINIKNYGNAATPAIHPYIEGHVNGQLWRADGSQPGSAVIQAGQTQSFQVQQDLSSSGTWNAEGIYLWNNSTGQYWEPLPNGSTFSFNVTDPPSVPNPPSLSSPGNNSTVGRYDSVTLYWYTSSGASQYYAEFWGGPGWSVNSGWTSGTSFFVGSSFWGGRYQWHVKARNSSNQESGWSDTWNLYRMYGAPSNLSASAASCTQMNLSWSASADAPGNIDGYRIYRNGSAVNTVGNTTTTYNDTGLSGSSTYNYVVKAYKGSAESDASNQVSPSTGTCGPGTPTLTSPSNNSTVGRYDSVTIAWNSSSGASQYYAEFWGGPGWSVNSGWTSSTSFFVGSTFWGGRYQWHVKARNSSNQESGWSDTWNLYRKYGAPSSLTASIALSQVNLSWNASADGPGNIDGYRIYRNGSAIGTVGASSTTFSDSGATCFSTYAYLVKAYKGSDESDPSNTFSTTINQCPPYMPSNLRVLTGSITASAIPLLWDDNSNNETGFKIYKWGYTGSGWDFIYLSSVGANVTTFTDTNLSCATTFYYQVSAYNTYGESSRAGWIAPSTGECAWPNPPSNLVVLSGSATTSSLPLVWQDNSKIETGSRINRYDGFSVHYGYVGPNVTTYTDTGLDCGSSYTYDVVAFNAAGESWSNEASGSTLACAGPNKPTNLRIATASITSSSIPLVWDDNSNDETQFKIYKWSGSTYVYVASVGANINTFTVNGLTCESYYYFWVSASNGAGESAKSNQAGGTTGTCPGPTKPSNLHVLTAAVTDSSIPLVWDDNSNNETGFTLYRWNGSAYALLTSLGANVTTYTDRPLQCATVYSYEVKSFNAQGTSGPAWISGVTSICLPNKLFIPLIKK